MTMKLRATRFHIRRQVPATPPPPAPQEMLFDNHDDGFGGQSFVRSGSAEPATATAMKVPRAASDTTAALAAIKAEGLTSRQLRTARRVAETHKLAPLSDLDAVRLLRLAGIEPFQKSSLLAMLTSKVVPQPDETSPPVSTSRALTALPGDGVQLPQTVQPIRKPSTEQRAEVNQAAEILRMQQDIARRRRRNLALLAARMFVFVLLPTIIAGWYYYRVATPLYATRTEFQIQQAGPAAASSLGSLFSGTALATSTDSIAVQGYLQSRDAMMRLDQDLGFRAHFQNPAIDPLQRLATDATQESAYRAFKKYVKISYDPTEGIIKMEVLATDPQTATAWANQLITYAEDQVDHLTQRLRGDQMKNAKESYETAEKALLNAQRKLVELQEKFNVLSSEAEVAMLTSQINGLETQLTQERLSLAQMESNQTPNLARMEPVKRRIATLEEQVASLRSKMTQGSAGEESLARMQSELLVAQADVQTRQLILAQTLTSMEVARTEANRQVRYLSMAVSPTPPDEAAYPRAFENTMVAMLILLGIYLMVSMTAAILREQVSA